MTSPTRELEIIAGRRAIHLDSWSTIDKFEEPCRPWVGGQSDLKKKGGEETEFQQGVTGEKGDRRMPI